jgi:hypothetical protein
MLSCASKRLLQWDVQPSRIACKDASNRRVIRQRSDVSEPISSAIKPRSVEAMAAREVRRVQLSGVVALLGLAAIVALSRALQRPPTPVAGVRAADGVQRAARVRGLAAHRWPRADANRERRQ